MNKNASHLFFIYEPEHIPLIKARRAAREEFEVIALDYEVELELKKLGMPFTSLRDLAMPPTNNRPVLEAVRAAAYGWYTAPETSFFKHDGIFLGEQHEVVVLYYTGTLVYYLSVLGQVLGKFPAVKKVTIQESRRVVPPTADPVARFKERLPVDTLRFLANRRGLEYTLVGEPVIGRAAKTSSLARLVAGVSNFFVHMFTKPRPIKILASDPWSRLKPFIKDMPDAELVMTRRQELPAMGLSAVWRHRVRFHHRLDFVDASLRAVAEKKAQAITDAWRALGERPGIAKLFEHEGVSFWPLMKPVFDSLVTEHAQDAIETIENTKHLIACHGINRVLLFASTKGYNTILARVAEQADIPSIELQHALTNTEKSLVHMRLNSRFLAAYGALTRKIYENVGVAAWRIIECGSPRFDSYATPVAHESMAALYQKLQLQPGRLRVLINVPQVYLSLEPEGYTTYDVQGVLELYAGLQKKIPLLQYLLRPRPGPWHERYYNRAETLGLFAPDTRMVQYDNLRTLFELADMVITGSSTFILEALMARKPVIIYIPNDLDHDNDDFIEGGAALMARTPAELERHVLFLTDESNRRELVLQADEFVKNNFLLDGKASERVAALLRMPPALQSKKI